jgi:2-polyprenyl-3-methyl-5-hydroxy-6-metoxy-1,4-benzoquinol methylase
VLFTVQEGYAKKGYKGIYSLHRLKGLRAMLATTPAPVYVLGHTNTELDRLLHQNRFWGDLTEQWLRHAGIVPGMTVVDMGCGTGDVTLLLSRMVGEWGKVIGVDRSPEVIARAQERARRAGVRNVRFEVADVFAYEPYQKVDAVAGRFFLMYMEDPTAVVRRVTEWVKPRGLVMFQELNLSAAHSRPPMRLFWQMMTIVNETFARADIHVDLGMELPYLFQLAGYPVEDTLIGGRIQSGADAYTCTYLADMIWSLLPLAENLGVVRADEVGIETLENRLRAELVAYGGCHVAPTVTGAWARV